MNDAAVIAAAELMAPRGSLGALRDFYVGCLGFSAAPASGAGLQLRAGPASIRFEPTAAAQQPFYHFALLVPGNRFAAAASWAGRCAGLLSRPGETTTTFRFRAWDAEACYLHDPAGNIVELIAHRGVAERVDGRGEDPPFSAAEIAGVSEVGLVVSDPPDAARTLAAAGVPLWSGTAEGEAALAFVGRQAHTLILCRPGRPWLPTQRPAELHPAAVTIAAPGGRSLTAAVRDGRLAVR
ncbi:MAG TPA: hypothetical protein VFN87_07005 [Solirubrobacteraceae bacterium]|nr:hypothetical protein [Solirubrobacteraceae bacterium]